MTFFSSRLICKKFSNTWGSVNYTTYTIIQFLTSCYVPHTFKMVVVISELLWYPHPQSTKAILKRHKTCQIPCKHFFSSCVTLVSSHTAKKRSVQFASHFWNGVIKNLHSKLNGSNQIFISLKVQANLHKDIVDHFGVDFDWSKRLLRWILRILKVHNKMKQIAAKMCFILIYL